MAVVVSNTVGSGNLINCMGVNSITKLVPPSRCHSLVENSPYGKVNIRHNFYPTYFFRHILCEVLDGVECPEVVFLYGIQLTILY